MNNELESIVKNLAECGWDVVDAPAKAWLKAKDGTTKANLIAAVKQADEECGSCGCEMDPLYKKALELLAS